MQISISKLSGILSDDVFSFNMEQDDELIISSPNNNTDLKKYSFYIRKCSHPLILKNFYVQSVNLALTDNIKIFKSKFKSLDLIECTDVVIEELDIATSLYIKKSSNIIINSSNLKHLSIYKSQNVKVNKSYIDRISKETLEQIEIDL